MVLQSWLRDLRMVVSVGTFVWRGFYRASFTKAVLIESVLKEGKAAQTNR